MPNSDEINDILNELKNRPSDPPSDTAEIDKNTHDDAPPSEDDFDAVINELTSDVTFDEKEEVAPAHFTFEETTPDKQEAVELILGTENYQYSEDIMNNADNRKKITIISVIAVIVAVAVGVGIYFAMTNKKEPVTTEPTTVTTTKPVPVVNPFTGEAEYNSAAMGKRPVACVVENAVAARPQWGINSPDIILEGEVEGGESRMLWIYADYTSVPNQIGPIRSARPPYIKFSELFDAIFIHWGQSKGKGNYVGANDVFKKDNVDHINEMSYKGKVSLFSRDKSRNVSSEHTGVLHGDKLAQAIDEYGFRTELNSSSYTTFTFNKTAAPAGETPCTALSLRFSSRTKIRDWTYSESDKMYHSTDYKTDVTRKNLIVLYDATEYVAKSNYKGSGSSEIYCNYKLAGGKGVLASEGTSAEITWSTSNGVLEIKDAAGTEIKLNIGKTWIGYASSNNGGNASIS